MRLNFTKAKWINDSAGFWLCIGGESSQIVPFVEGMKEKTYTAEIKEYRKKRSLDANAYLWALINEISNVLRADKEEVYKQMLRRYGQTGLLRVMPDYVEAFKRSQKYWEVVHESEKYTDFQFWVGSSLYNSREMSILIDGVVSECRELGIETRPKEEIDAMIEAWGKL